MFTLVFCCKRYSVVAEELVLARTGQIEVAQMRWAKMLKLQLLLTLTNRVHRAEGPQEISSRCYWCQHEMQAIHIFKEYELFVSGNITSATGDSRASRAARQTSSSMPTSSRFSEVINDDNIDNILSSHTIDSISLKSNFPGSATGQLLWAVSKILTPFCRIMSPLIGSYMIIIIMSPLTGFSLHLL